MLFLSCFVMLSFTSICWCLVVTCWADLLALVWDVYLWRCHFPIGMLGQVWCLIVLIPDLCPLSYFHLWLWYVLKSRQYFKLEMDYPSVCMIHAGRMLIECCIVQIARSYAYISRFPPTKDIDYCFLSHQKNRTVAIATAEYLDTCNCQKKR